MNQLRRRTTDRATHAPENPTKGAPNAKRKRRPLGREAWHQGFGVIITPSGPIVPFIERSTAERVARLAVENMLEYMKIDLQTEVVGYHDYYGYREVSTRPALES